jgi:hypothetical protein
VTVSAAPTSRFGWKLFAVLATLAVVVALYVWWVAGYLRVSPPTVPATYTTSAPGVARVTLQTVGSIGFGEHPTWVSYLAREPNGQWVHSTVIKVPADSLVHVTLYEYDGSTVLRNHFFGQVQGTAGGVAYANGKPYTVLDGATQVAHTFTIPDLDVNVPLYAPSSKNLCSVAPCDPKYAHTVITFSFRTGAPAVYRWQCFIPCGLSFLYGNGGPMSTMGYMAGFLDVVKA